MNQNIQLIELILVLIKHFQIIQHQIEINQDKKKK